MHQAVHQDQELELDLRQLWQALMRRKWIILALFAAASIAAYVASNAMTPVYEATTTVLVKRQQPSLGLQVMEGLAGTPQTQVQNSLELFRSRRLAERTAERLGYDFDVYSSEFAAFRKSITVQPASGSDTIRISVQHADPVEAQRIANTLVQTYIEQSQLMNSEDMRAAREFVEGQLAKFAAELEAAEESLVRYKEEAAIVAPSGETEAVLTSISRLETMRAEAEVAIQTARSRLEALTGELGSEQRNVVSATVVASDPLISSFRAQLASLEAELAAALEQYTERHPRVIELRARIGEIQREMNEQISRLESTNTDTRLSVEIIDLQAEILAQTAKVEALDEMIADREALLGDLPEKELRLTRLIRNATVTEKIYTMLLERYEEMRISEAMETANVMVLDPAIVPRTPVKPRTKLNVAIAGFLGMFVGIGLAFLLEYFDTTFKQAEEVEAYLGLPVLGRAPVYNGSNVYSRRRTQ